MKGGVSIEGLCVRSEGWGVRIEGVCVNIGITCGRVV